MFRASLIFATLFGVATVHAADHLTYAQQVNHWQTQRLQRLTAPYGWLSLVALPWLQQGVNTIGSTKDNDISIASAPAHLGVVDWHKDGTVSIELASGVHASINGKHQRRSVLLDDSHDQPTVVRFGTTEFYLIDRNGRKGLRVKDSHAASRMHFAGLEYFPVDPSLRVLAKWLPFVPPQTLKMGNEIGAVDSFPVPGKAVFDYQGHRYTLYPVIDDPDDGQYFVVFADATSGKETYAAARFLYIDKPKDGHVMIDFNKAYNPPCAFTPYATCPLAPAENRLGFRVTAGEKVYRGLVP